MILSLGEIARTRRDDLRSSRDLEMLASRLDVMLSDVHRRSLYVPSDKALLSQDGGVCPVDGARLVFDPFDPHKHHCGVCRGVFSGKRHHRAWVWRYHLWLSERAIHGALLAALGRSEEESHRWSTHVLETYAARYRSFPNQDNVLGPTRLFFSTYLESIWLLQLILAAMILCDGVRSISPTLRHALENMIAESSELIASFDEGLSNRQVWNATAVLAAGLFLGDEGRITHGLSGPGGIESLLRNGVGANGRWHEGENYHFFALRGFLFAAELASLLGQDLYEEYACLRLMYTAPLATTLPDLTLAARGDSPYGVSLRQPRFAELWEIGFARTGDQRIADILSQLYDGTGQQNDIGLEEIAEVEQNRPPMKVSRTDLGWKALLWMRNVRPTSGGGDNNGREAVLVEPRGPVVIRTDDGRYVALEGAGTGLGHGHPDRLHLSIFDRGPILMDFGTGSYVDASLHWYRSWLSHNVPNTTGGNGRAGWAWCTAFDQSDEWQWCRASVEDFTRIGSSVDRSVVVGPDYVIDILDVDVPRDVVVDLPLHLLGYEIDTRLSDQPIGLDIDTGYDDMDVRRVLTARSRLSSRIDGRGDVFLPARPGEERFVVKAPGPPPLSFGQAAPQPFILRRCAGTGRWVHVFARSPDSVREVRTDGATIVVRTATGTDTLRPSGEGVVIESGGVTVRLAGLRAASRGNAKPVSHTLQRFRCPVFDNVPSSQNIEKMLATGHVLDGTRYRRSEHDYGGVDKFSARWCMFAVARRVFWRVDVRKGHVYVRPPDASNPRLDNETPDIHSDGMQIYFGDMSDPNDPSENSHQAWRGFLLVPDEREPQNARVRSVRGLSALDDNIDVSFGITDTGFRATVSTVIPALPQSGAYLPFDLVINEMHEDRERRAGQLALSGPGWVYLRGDRESPHTASLCVFD